MNTLTGIDEKIKKFFEAIDDIETQSDGSIIINWKSNVAHNVNGHLITNTSEYNISLAKEIHLNPVWSKEIDHQVFSETQDEIQKGKQAEREIMSHKFVIKEKGEFLYYDDVKDIPESFDHLIRFEPEIPPGPHTHEQHEEIARWNDVLQDLMKRERKNIGD